MWSFRQQGLCEVAERLAFKRDKTKFYSDAVYHDLCKQIDDGFSRGM